MPALVKRTYARYTLKAVELLGSLIRSERKSHRIAEQSMAERLSVSRGTLRRLEQGDPKVELGIAFEACTYLGIPLFEPDAQGLNMRLEDTAKRLALLPARVRNKTPKVSDDF